MYSKCKCMRLVAISCLLCLQGIHVLAQEPTGDPMRKGYNLLQLGQEAAEKGSLDDAISFFERSRDLLPDNGEVVYYLGICHCRKGDYLTGIALLEESYERTLDPDILIPIKNAYFMNGLQYARNKKYDDAKKSFNRVIEIDPHEGKAYFNRGVCFLAENNYESALADFDMALENDFSELQLLFNKAVALEKTGQIEAAMDMYKSILQDKPLFASAHYNLAKLQEEHILETGEYDRFARDAVYHYQRALEIDPSFYEAAFNIANIYYTRGDVAVAIKWLKKCIELNEDFGQGYLFLAKMYMEKDAYNNVLSQLEILEEKGYTFPEIQQMRDKIYQITGKSHSVREAENSDEDRQ